MKCELCSRAVDVPLSKMCSRCLNKLFPGITSGTWRPGQQKRTGGVQKKKKAAAPKKKAADPKKKAAAPKKKAAAPKKADEE
jgi:hypothetical protein